MYGSEALFLWARNVTGLFVILIYTVTLNNGNLPSLIFIFEQGMFPFIKHYLKMCSYMFEILFVSLKKIIILRSHLLAFAGFGSCMFSKRSLGITVPNNDCCCCCFFQTSTC